MHLLSPLGCDRIKQYFIVFITTPTSHPCSTGMINLEEWWIEIFSQTWNKTCPMYTVQQTHGQFRDYIMWSK